MKPWLFPLISIFSIVSYMSAQTNLRTMSPYLQERLLIITADDFGASKNIDEGIEIAADKQAITTISALTNFTQALSDLKRIARNHPEIGIGVHLNITTGKPYLSPSEVPTLVKPNGNFYTLEELLPVINKISADDLRKELRAQIGALLISGIIVDHLSDQNGVLSFYGPFFDIMVELAVEFNVPVRSPQVAGVKYPDLFPNSKMNAYGRQLARRLALKEPLKAISLVKYSRISEVSKKVKKLDNHGIPHPDLLIEYFWGDPSITNLNYILEHLPQGTSELILHLGSETRLENYPSGLDRDYFKNRENELKTITSDYLKEYFTYLNIKTIGYSALININE
jgi:predicted glycoside hydrolase/deacetylase ChbG (UPF0249 family)